MFNECKSRKDLANNLRLSSNKLQTLFQLWEMTGSSVPCVSAPNSSFPKSLPQNQSPRRIFSKSSCFQFNSSPATNQVASPNKSVANLTVNLSSDNSFSYQDNHNLPIPTPARSMQTASTSTRTPGSAIRSRFSLAVPDFGDDDDEDEEGEENEEDYDDMVCEYTASNCNRDSLSSVHERSTDYSDTDRSYNDNSRNSNPYKNLNESINYTNSIYKSTSPTKKKVSLSPRSKGSSSTRAAIPVNKNGGIDPSHLGIGIFRGDVINDGITSEFDGFKFEHSKMMMKVGRIIINLCCFIYSYFLLTFNLMLKLK